MAKTADEFVRTYNGKAIDDDGAYGVQCVDGFRVFCKWALGKVWNTGGTGTADGYWYNRNRYANDFIAVPPSQIHTGDWVIWKKGSKSHPSSHIAMYYYGKEFGQNQGGNRAFCLKNTDFSDALGALRWKPWKDYKEPSASTPKPQPAKPAAKSDGRNHTIAYSKSSAYAKTYTTTANLNIRKGWTTGDASLGIIPKGGKFTCYGYYTQDWLYGTAVIKGKTITGFCNKNYLR